MSELSPRSRALLEVARGGEEPSAADVARVRASMLAKVAAPVPAPGARPALGVKAVIAVAVAVGVGVGAYWAYRGRGAPAVREVALQAPSPRVTSIVEPPREPALPALPIAAPSPASSAPAPGVSPSPAASPPPRPHRARAAAPPADSLAASSTDAIREERALLAAANGALQRDDAAAALRALATHAARFPTGILAEERAATQVRALCAAGRTDDAATSREAFLARWPRSVHAARVRAACAGE